MNLKFKKRIGLTLILIGIFIIIAQPASMTGAVIDISTTLSRVWFFIGIGAMIGGSMLIYMASKNKLVRILRQELKSGAINNSKYLIRNAQKLGYDLKNTKGSIYKVFKSDGEPLIGKSGRQTEIHNHPRDMARGTYMGVLVDLVENV